MTQKRSYIKDFAQKLYLTFSAFMSNDLISYAAAGAYGFLLSSLPIILMVIVVLVRIFNASPASISDILNSITVFSDSFDLDEFLTSILSIRSIGFLEIIVGISIFWMARRFFMSIQRSMRIIYKKRGKAKPLKENLIVFAGEALLIILITITIIIFIASKAFLSAGFSKTILGPVIWPLAKITLNYLPGIVLWFFLLLVFYIMPRSRPPFRISFAYATLCTISFIVTQLVFKSFVNLTQYNLVYGFLSNVIVLLLEVFVFFILLLFFAQLQYIDQFFESFLLAELYLFPEKKNKSIILMLEEWLFLDTPSLNRKYLIYKKKGDVIYNFGDSTKEIYYIKKGTVSITQKNKTFELKKGAVFGELSVLIGGNRTATAKCKTNCQLLKFPEQLFTETIETNGDFSRRTLQSISEFVLEEKI